MIYSYANGVLTTYNVKVDTEKLEQIKESIIENCSVIKHCLVFFEKDNSNSQNFSIKLMKQIWKNLIKNMKINCEKSDKNYDAYTYDEYIVPEIINIIERIIVYGEDSLIKDLFNTSDISLEEENIIKYKSSSFLEAFDEMKNDFFSKCGSGNLVKENKIIDKNNSCEITLPKKSIKDYYGELQTCFELTKVQEFSAEFEELYNIKTKYGDNWYEELISKLNNLKKLEEAKETSVDYQFIKRFGKSGKSKKN